MEMEGYQAGFFEIEHYGIPLYDELVFITGARGFEKEGLKSVVFSRPWKKG